MIFIERSKSEIRSKAWGEVLYKFVTIQAYADAVGVPRETARDWMNNEKAKVSFPFLAKTEVLTGISIERLSPFTEEENRIMRQWQNTKQLNTIEMLLDEIVIKNSITSNCFESRIIVDVNGRLISGWSQIEKLRAEGKRKALVSVLDLEVLLLEMRTLQDISVDFLINERVDVGLSLKELAGSHQGERTDLVSNLGNENLKNDKNNGQLRRKCSEVRGKIDQKIAKIVGLSSRDSYIRAMKVCLQGIQELVYAMNHELVSINKAFQLSKSPKEQQQELLNIWLSSHKRKVCNGY